MAFQILGLLESQVSLGAPPLPPSLPWFGVSEYLRGFVPIAWTRECCSVRFLEFPSSFLILASPPEFSPPAKLGFNDIRGKIVKCTNASCISRQLQLLKRERETRTLSACCSTILVDLVEEMLDSSTVVLIADLLYAAI